VFGWQDLGKYGSIRMKVLTLPLNLRIGHLAQSRMPQSPINSPPLASKITILSARDYWGGRRLNQGKLTASKRSNI
jgi:hypothetical protein